MADDVDEGSAAMRGSLAWIPVRERIPGTSERVLVFCPLLEPDEIVVATLAANGIWECDDGQILGETEPTHWMPLPELVRSLCAVVYRPSDDK